MLAGKIARLAAAVVGLLLPAVAQTMIGAKAGLLSYTEGEVYLDGKPVESSLTQWPRMQDKQWMRTANGRAEMLLNPCVVLHLDRNSALRMVSASLADTRVELSAGRAELRDRGNLKNTRVLLLMNGAAVALTREGVYRFESDPPELMVFTGKAEVESGGRKAVVAQGWSLALGSGEHAAAKFDPQRTDGFDYWSMLRMAILAKANGSGRRSHQQSANDAAARANSVDAQLHDPASIYYDPNAPNQRALAPLPTPSLSGSGGCVGSPW